jgi:2-polyprenyl-3-methyl-5-hydroxy-6-metoxy-1,4-benzoquinol methylase
MTTMKLQRRVLPERLDVMPADDPAARRSRRDLQRVHRVMRSLTILRRALARLHATGRPHTILELGAGDGSLMLRLAQAAGSSWRKVRVTFLDRQNLIGAQTLRQFAGLDWDVQVQSADALAWARASTAQHYDLCVTTLFLHHFQSPDLKELLRAVATRCDAFVACEPRRNGVAWVGSHLLGLLGANEITREDGVTSVVAGFSNHELSALWASPGAQSWQLQEYFAWPFTHCFLAQRQTGATSMTASS